jgi:hypothetical protein
VNVKFEKRLIGPILILLFAAAGATAQSGAFGGTRDLISRVQNDLKRAADFGNNGDVKKVKRDEKQIERYRNAQRSASNFDRKLSRGKFDKGELDGVINDLKNVVEHNTLESQDRDALTNDLRDLRDLRARD